MNDAPVASIDRLQEEVGQDFLRHLYTVDSLERKLEAQSETGKQACSSLNEALHPWRNCLMLHEYFEKCSEIRKAVWLRDPERVLGCFKAKPDTLALLLNGLQGNGGLLLKSVLESVSALDKAAFNTALMNAALGRLHQEMTDMKRATSEFPTMWLWTLIGCVRMPGWEPVQKLLFTKYVEDVVDTMLDVDWGNLKKAVVDVTQNRFLRFREQVDGQLCTASADAKAAWKDLEATLRGRFVQRLNECLKRYITQANFRALQKLVVLKYISGSNLTTAVTTMALAYFTRRVSKPRFPDRVMMILKGLVAKLQDQSRVPSVACIEQSVTKVLAAVKGCLIQAVSGFWHNTEQEQEMILDLVGDISLLKVPECLGNADSYFFRSCADELIAKIAEKFWAKTKRQHRNVFRNICDAWTMERDVSESYHAAVVGILLKLIGKWMTWVGGKRHADLKDIKRDTATLAEFGERLNKDGLYQQFLEHFYWGESSCPVEKLNVYIAFRLPADLMQKLLLDGRNWTQIVQEHEQIWNLHTIEVLTGARRLEARITELAKLHSSSSARART